MDEKISVIVPVYNMEKYLKRCLESILNNTYKNIEVICVNDGSTDKSEEILYSYIRKDGRVSVCSQNNEGVSAARNRGLLLATGKYIAFVDSDDWVHPQYFEFLLKALLENRTDMALCNYIQTKDYKELSIDYEYYRLSEKIYGINLLQSHKKKTYVWGKLYRKNIIENIYFQKEIKGAEDAMFNTLVACNNKQLSVACIKEKLYFYFEREKSLKSELESKVYLYLCKSYNDLQSTITDCRYLSILNTEIFKRALFARYYESLLKENKNNYIESKYYLKLSFGRLVKSKELSYKNKIVYFFFLVSPLTYRIFRILNDPTMLYWEQNCRKNRKKR